MGLQKFHDAEEAINSLIAAFNLFRQAIHMPRGSNDSAASDPVNKHLAQAETTSKLAEAASAKILGFQLCQCRFPPTPMLLVGDRKLGSAFSGSAFGTYSGTTYTPPTYGIVDST